METETDLSGMGAPILYSIFANEDEKFVAQYASFQICPIHEAFKGSVFLLMDMKILDPSSESL